MLLKYLVLIFTLIVVAKPRPQQQQNGQMPNFFNMFQPQGQQQQNGRAPGSSDFISIGDDGKVSVNFFGFKAEASLGGLVNQETGPSGGASAKVSTPYGHQAAAGIGGQASPGAGGAYGGVFATASEGNKTASIVARGNTKHGEDNGGFLETVATNKYGTKRTVQTHAGIEEIFTPSNGNAIQNNPVDVHNVNVVQKIKSPKKFSGQNFIKDGEDNDNNEALSYDIDTRFVDDLSALPSIKVEKSVSAVNGDDVNIKAIAKTINAEIEPQTIAKTNTGDASPPTSSQVYTYHKNIRPLRRRFHVQKQFIPFVDQYQQPSVVEIQKRSEDGPAPVNNYSKTKTTLFAVPAENPQPSIVKQTSVRAEGQIRGQGFFDGIFNIPIATLRAVNDFLNQGFGQGSVAVKKTVDIQQHN